MSSRNHVGARYAADVDRAYRAALRRAVSSSRRARGTDDVPDGYLDQLIRDDVFRASIAELVHDELADITRRYLPLTCDPRMKSVWRELSRHNSNGGFLHPAIGMDRDAALLELFNTALECREVAVSHDDTTAGRA